MPSKEAILSRLRSTKLPDAQLPALDGSWTTFPEPNRKQHYEQVLQAVGGQLESVADVAELNSRLADIEPYRTARVVRSAMKGVGPDTAYWQATDDPHALEDTDFCIVPGQFAVAENGAVWIDGASLPHRAALFITQHLALVVPESEIVSNMHEAYERLTLGDARFGIFVSGPSKTADIEQSLVIGAHGARSLIVFLIRDQG